MIGALILAAGRGTRFGSDKRLARLDDGRTMLAATVETYLEAIEEVRVVLRDSDDPVSLLPPHLRARIAVTRSNRAEGGMGFSLADGIPACEGWRAAMVTLGDMPFIAPDTIGTIVHAWAHLASNQMCALRPYHRGEAGHPVVFDVGLFDRLGQSSGDEGGRRALLAARIVHRLDTQDPGVVKDVDRPRDVDRQRI